jgi:hypothetical protein
MASIFNVVHWFWTVLRKGFKKWNYGQNGFSVQHSSWFYSSNLKTISLVIMFSFSVFLSSQIVQACLIQKPYWVTTVHKWLISSEIMKLWMKWENVLYGELEKTGKEAVHQSSQFKQWYLIHNTRISSSICSVSNMETTTYERNLDKYYMSNTHTGII